MSEIKRLTPAIPNNFFPDRCLAYQSEFDLFQQAGIRPGFWQIGDEIYGDVVSGKNRAWILEKGIREGATSLSYYLKRVKKGASVSIVDSIQRQTIESPAHTYKTILHNVTYDLGLDTDGSEPDMNSAEFLFRMKELVKQNNLLIFMDDYDQWKYSLRYDEFGQLTKTLAELVNAGNISVLLSMDVRKISFWESMLKLNFPSAMNNHIRLPLLSTEDVRKMANLVVETSFDESAIQQIFYLTGGNPVLTQLLFYEITRCRNANIYTLPPHYPHLAQNTELSVEEINFVAIAHLRNTDAGFIPNFFLDLSLEQRALIFKLAFRTAELYSKGRLSHIIDLKTIDKEGSDKYPDPERVHRLMKIIEDHIHGNYDTSRCEFYFSNSDGLEAEILQSMIPLGLVKEIKPGVYEFGSALLLWRNLVDLDLLYT